MGWKEDAEMDAMSKVEVAYKYVDGMHFFVSAGKDSAGLCVANEDLATAYEEVGKQLSAIAKFNYKKDRKFQPAIPLADFTKIIAAYKSITDSITDLVNQKGILTTSTMQPWIPKIAVRHREVA